MEKLYLRCDDCGEVFDALETAHGHEAFCLGDVDGWHYTIVRESEAF